MDAALRHPYADFLGAVEKPSRYVGGEVHSWRPPVPGDSQRDSQAGSPAGVRREAPGVAAAQDARAPGCRVCLAFPDVYEIGMSHLGTKILYSVLNKTHGIACERTFSPWLDMEAELRRRGLPLVSLESWTPLGDFDVIGISLQYELTYTNVLGLLDLAGLPLRAAERGDQAPLVLCGGPTATHPEPIAPFIDAFFIGEAEEKLPALCLEFARLRGAGVPRRERLVRLAAEYPLYVPELYDTLRDPDTGFVVVGAPRDPRVPARPRRTWIEDINRFPFPDDSPVPYAEAIFDRMAVEVARGCTEGCRFCQAGMIYRPVRERDPVAVLDALVEGVRKGGYDETSLTSLSTADYSCVAPLVRAAMARLRDERVSLSVSSLRAYGLHEDLLADMATMRAQGLTFAPEAGTQRMRDVIAKNVTEAHISEAAERAFRLGYQRAKLYFMIGLPTEEDEDVRGIVETAARVQDIGRRTVRGARVRASVSTHVPKPHTPFQWAAMDSLADTERKQRLLADEARRLRVDLKMHENHQSHLEAIFSRGDRTAADLLERAFRLGCRFDGWDDVLRLDLWEQAMEDARAGGFEPEHALGTIPVGARLPWDHIDVGLADDFLPSEYRRALKNRLSPPCGKPFRKLLHPRTVAEAEADGARKLVCYDCGIACDLGAMKQERLTYLRRMNAWQEPPAVAPPAVLAARKGDGPTPRVRPSPGRARAEAPDPASLRRYRIRYHKTGRAVYLGHLDLVRHLPRVFRRAGLALAYSAGFHPQPDVTYGPALGLGIASLGELLDARLVDETPPLELVARLNAVSLDGVEFREAVMLDGDDPGLGRVIARASYAALLPSADAVAGALAAHRDGRPLALTRAPKGPRAAGGAASGIGRRIDVRASLTEVEPSETPGSRNIEVPGAFGWPADRVLRFGLTVRADGGARPSEALAALCGAEVAADAQIARLGLWAAAESGAGAADAATGWMDPLDRGALRRQSALRTQCPPSASVRHLPIPQSSSDVHGLGAQ